MCFTDPTRKTKYITYNPLQFSGDLIVVFFYFIINFVTLD